MKNNAEKARGLGAAELAKELRDSAEQMFRLRFQLSMGQADGLKKLRQLRRERARMLTVQRERELGKEVVAGAVKTPKAPKAAKPQAQAKPEAEHTAAKTGGAHAAKSSKAKPAKVKKEAKPAAKAAKKAKKAAKAAAPKAKPAARSKPAKPAGKKSSARKSSKG
jgi:large subunit ribosomal protein L29